MKTEKALLSAAFVLILSIFSVNAAFRDGVDTTDTEGNGLDSLFSIRYGQINGQVVAHYCFNQHWCSGYFTLSFEDICFAPDTVIHDDLETHGKPFYCFVVKNPRTNTYSKIQILAKLGDNRYTYRYLTNTTSGERLLSQDNPSIAIQKKKLQKVNNVHFTGFRYSLHSGTDPIHTMTLSWDPPALTYFNTPVPNLKYLLYVSKDYRSIDTTKPIDRSQWMPISLSKSPQTVSQFPQRGYVNMVSIIGQDTSDFLSGWTWCDYDIIGIQENNFFQHKKPIEITVKNSADRIMFSLSSSEISSKGIMTIFNLAGGKIATLPFIGNTAILKKQQVEFCHGGYIICATIPDKEMVITRFMCSQLQTRGIILCLGT